MSVLKINTIEHCVDGIVVSQKVIKLFGLPIFTRHTETSNYNYVGQFDANNFTNNTIEESKKVPLYTETHIGFANEENAEKSSQETTRQDSTK